MTTIHFTPGSDSTGVNGWVKKIYYQQQDWQRWDRQALLFVDFYVNSVVFTVASINVSAFAKSCAQILQCSFEDGMWYLSIYISTYLNKRNTDKMEDATVEIDDGKVEDDEPDTLY